MGLQALLVQACAAAHDFTDVLSSRAIKASPSNLADLDVATLGKLGHLTMSQRASPLIKPSALRTPPRSCLVPPASFFNVPSSGRYASTWTNSKSQFRGMATSTEADEEAKIGAVG